MKLLSGVVLVLVVVYPSRLRSDEKKTPSDSKVDMHGDALPANAIARYGTTRFRHADAPWDMTWSPDGTLMASYTVSPSTMHVWDARSGKEICRVSAPNSTVGYYTVAITPDNRLLGGGWFVWEIATGKEHLKLNGDFKAMSADGKRVACFYFRETHVWDLANRKLIGKYVGAFAGLSRDGKRVTTTLNDTTTVYDVDSGKELHQIKGKYIAQFDGEIVVHSDTKSVELWSTETGQKILDRPIATNQWGYYPNLFPYHSFSKDGRVFAVLDQKDKATQSVFVFDTRENKELCKIDPPKDGSFLQVRLSPDGKRVAAVTYVAGGTATVRTWDTATGKLLQKNMTGHRVGISPDGKIIATTLGHAIRLWDAETGEVRHSHPGPYAALRSLSFAPDGKSLIAGYDEETAFRIWDSRTTKKIRNIPHDSPGWEKLAVISPNRDQIALVQRAVISFRSSMPKAEFNREFDPNSSIAWITYIPDGSQLACLELRNTEVEKFRDWPKYQPHFHFLDAATGKDVPSAKRPRWSEAIGRIVPDSISSHGLFHFTCDSRIATWQEGRSPGIHLREIATGKSLPSPPELKPYVSTLGISSDSRYLAVATDQVLRIWDIAAANEVAAFEGGCGAITCIAFAPDCRSVAAGYRHSTVVCFELPNPEPIPLKPNELDGLWNDLASTDTAVSYRAIAKLRGDAKATEKLLEERLFEVDKTLANRLATALQQLEDDQFARRQAAAADILQIGQRAIRVLRAARMSSPSVDVRERIDKLLKSLSEGVFSSDDARRLRAIQILEQIGHGLLEKMASGNEGWITDEAKEAFERVQRRQARSK